MTAKRKQQPAAEARTTNADPVIAAIDAVNAAGHRSMRPSPRVVACWKCDAEGIVGPDGKRVGEIFTKGCGK